MILTGDERGLAGRFGANLSLLKSQWINLPNPSLCLDAILRQLNSNARAAARPEVVFGLKWAAQPPRL
jgi:hypothetical protein